MYLLKLNLKNKKCYKNPNFFFGKRLGMMWNLSNAPLSSRRMNNSGSVKYPGGLLQINDFVCGGVCGGVSAYLSVSERRAIFTPWLIDFSAWFHREI